MANKKQNIDDLFKDHMTDDASHLLDGNEWDKIYEELHGKKKKGFFWLWILLGFLLLGGVLTYYVVQNNFTELTANSRTEVKSLGNTIDEANQGETTDVDSSTPRNQADYNNAESQTISDNQENSNLGTSDVTIVDGPLTNYAYQPSTNLGLPLSGTDTVMPTEHQNIEQVQNANNTRKPVKIDNLVSKTVDFEIEYFHGMSLKEYGKNCCSPAVPAIVEKTLFNTDPSKTPFTLSLSGNVGIVSQNINTISELSDYKNYRNSNEQNGLGQQYGVNIKYDLPMYYVSSGINYQKFTQRLGSATATSSLRYQLYDSIPFIVGADTVNYLRHTYRDTLETQNLTIPSYNYISIPLYIGKEISLSPKFKFDISGGLTPKFNIGASGNTNSTSLRIGSITKENIATFGLSGGSTVGLNYYIKPKLAIKWSIGGQYDILNISRIPGVNQRLGFYYTGLSFDYKF